MYVYPPIHGARFLTVPLDVQMLIAKMVSNLLESVWTMVGRPTVCWMRMREAMDRERGRKIISVRPSEISDSGIPVPGIYTPFVWKTPNSSCSCTVINPGDCGAH